MAKDERKDLPIRSFSRPGEGVVIETSRKMTPLPNGATTFEIRLNLGSAPVPERKYVANTAFVTYEQGVLYLLFGQRTVAVGEPKLRTLIVISVSSAGALSFLKSLEPIRSQLDPLRQLVGSNYPLQEVVEEPPAPQTVALAANMLIIAFSGREAVMDFYHASPFVLSQVQNNGKFAVDPVVRVILPSGLLLSLIAKMDEFKAKFPSEEVDAVLGAPGGTGQIGEVPYGSRNIR